MLMNYQIFYDKTGDRPMSVVLYNALRYAGFQSLVLAIMLGAGRPLSTKNPSKNLL